jgi:uncharacterized protein (DUF2237 family)
MAFNGALGTTFSKYFMVHIICAVLTAEFVKCLDRAVLTEVYHGGIQFF